MDTERQDQDLLAEYRSNVEGLEQANAAFAQIMERHGGLVYHTCLRVLGNRALAEDATQATFLVLARKAGSVHGNLRSYLHGVAFNVARRTRDGERMRRQREEEAAMEEDRRREGELAGAASWQNIKPELDEALQALPYMQQAALVNYYLAGETQEEAARTLGISRSSLDTHLTRGLTKLRARLGKNRPGLSVALLGTLFANHATAATCPAFLKAAAPQIAAAGAMGTGGTALSAKVVLMAENTIKMMLWAKIKSAAAGLLLVVTIGAGGMIAAEKPVNVPRPAANTQTSPPSPRTPASVEEKPVESVMVTPRAIRARTVFRELALAGGPAVTMLDSRWYRSPELGKGGGGWYGFRSEEPRKMRLFVPADMLHKEVDAWKLIEAVAATRDLKVARAHHGRVAVLYQGAADTNIKNVQRDLLSAEASVRRKGAWRAGWLRDIRILPLLVQAARDREQSVSRQARRSLARLNWEAVAALDPAVRDLLFIESDGPNAPEMMTGELAGLTHALARFGGERALLLFGRALKDTKRWMEPDGTLTGHRIGGSRARAIVEIVLETAYWEQRKRRIEGKNDLLTYMMIMAEAMEENIRCLVVKALANVKGEQAVALLSRAMADPCVDVRLEAVRALGSRKENRAAALLRKAIESTDAAVRQGAVEALGYSGDEASLPLLESALSDKVSAVRQAATIALGRIGGKQALDLLVKVIAGKDRRVHRPAVAVLGRFGDEEALPLIEKVLAGSDYELRRNAVLALADIGGEKPITLLEKSMTDRGGRVRSAVARSLGFIGGDKALNLLGKTLENPDAWVRCSALQALDDTGGEQALALVRNAIADRDKPLCNPRCNHWLNHAFEINVRTPMAALPVALVEQDQTIKDHRVRYLHSDLCLHAEDVLGEKAIPYLKKELLTSNESRARLGAVWALGRIGGEQALNLLEQAMDDRDWFVRTAIAGNLVRFAEDRAFDLLAAALRDPEHIMNRWVRLFAMGSLAAKGGNRARDILLNYLAVADSRVEQEVLIYLLKHSFATTPRNIPALPAEEKQLPVEVDDF